jgi:hypothetical protein
LLASRAVPGGIYDSVALVRNLEASLRFYRDGLGLDLSHDRQVEGDWPDLFDAPSRRVRSSSATREFWTTTPVSWSSTCLTVTSRMGRRLAAEDWVLPAVVFRRRRGHADSASGCRPQWTAPARQSIDTTRDANPGDRARPGRAARLAHPPGSITRSV